MNKREVTDFDHVLNADGAGRLSKKLLIVAGIISFIFLVVVVSVALARSMNVKMIGNDQLEVICEGRGLQVERVSRTQLNLTCRESREANPTLSPTSEPIAFGIVGFTVINADTNADIGPLTDGQTFDGSNLLHVYLRADSNPAQVGSVQFLLNGQLLKTDNEVPYTLGREDLQLGEQMPVGTYALVAVAYSESDAMGTAGPPYSVTFHISGTDHPEPPAPPPPIPTATPGGNNQPGGPYAGAPECPDHNPTAWHGLWDAERGCHYKHTHNADPSLADALFGPAGSAWGQTISYPWQTPHENEMKHEGYKYAVGLDKNCPEHEGYEYLVNQNRPPNCVQGFRIQYHSIGAARAANVRLHSYYAEIQVCTRDNSRCGIVKTGGWADFGILHAPYKTTIIPIPADPVPVNQGLHATPYRGHNPIDVAMEQARTGADNRYVWTSASRYGYNQIARFFFRALDDWGGINPNDPAEMHFICPDFQCKYNHSEHHVYDVGVTIHPSLDYDGDGFVTYSGYTDRQGNIVDNCAAPGLDCVPLEIVDAPVGFAVWSRGSSGPRPAGENIPDFDVSPPGEWWIEYPN